MKQQLVKPNAMKNTTMVIELVGCLVLILLVSWSSVRSSVTMAEMYAGCVRELSLFRFSTHSVFLIGNLIIIVVVVQSTKLSEKTTPTHKVQFVPHQYFIADQKIKPSSPLSNIADHKMKPDPQYHTADEKMKSRQRLHSSLKVGDFPDSKGISKFSSEKTQMDINIDRSVSERRIVPLKSAEAEQVSVRPESNQLYRRTMSSSYERGTTVNKRVIRPELTRSKTGKWGGGETMGAGRFDELNHDEFRRKIESFIEKQKKLIRDELVVGDAFSLKR